MGMQVDLHMIDDTCMVYKFSLLNVGQEQNQRINLKFTPKLYYG